MIEERESMKRIIFFIIICIGAYSGMSQETEIVFDSDSATVANAPSAAMPVRNPVALMDSAMNAYNAGMYTTALQNYLFIVDSLHLESAALYYNAGNAAFKMNDLASAILYYEKALKLNPKDEDILFNLGLANSRIPDKIEPVPEILLVGWYKTVVSLLTPNQWAYCAIILLAIALVLIALYFVARGIALRKVGFWAGTVLLVFCILTFIVAGQSSHHQIAHDTAIVFSPSVTIKSSPEQGSTDLFVLHEGAKVQIMESVNNWYKIKIANGSVGWIPVEAVEAI